MAKKAKQRKKNDPRGPEPQRVVRPSRLRAAWYVLMGQRLTPLQMEAEWVDYKAVFSDLLGRHSAMLARHAKAEKERIDRAFASLDPEDPKVIEAPSGSEKDVLRSKIFERSFGNQRPMPPAPEPLKEAS